MRHALLSFALVLCPFAAAHADMGPMPGEERFAAIMPQQQQSLGAQMGFAQLNEDFFMQLTLKTELNLGPVGLGLQVPLNLRVWDRNPKNNNDYYGLIRREDWDRPADFIKVLRYVRLGHKREPFYIRVGEIAATIGHGTIMNRYLNNLDVNAFRVGTEFDINTDFGGVETVVSDLGTLYDTKNPDSRILGMRAHIKPIGLMAPDSIANIFAFGASLVSDVNAPNTLTLDALGAPVVNKEKQLEVATTKAATVFGFDAEAELLHNALIDLVPYTDLNFIKDAGWGFHGGVMVTAKMPIGIDLTIPVRLEYRRFRSDYIPAYFGTFYEVERYTAAPGTSTVPKGYGVRALSSSQGLNGYYGDLAFDFAGLFRIGAAYEDYQGGDPNLQAFLAVPALETFQFKAFYARTHITGTNDIVKFDDRSMAVAEGRYQLVSYVYLVGRLSRRWVLQETGPKAGEYVGANDWKFGIEANLNF
jgi:hypothetical protein